MRKIKVCHICSLRMDGVAIFICNLLENTNFDTHDVTLIALGTIVSETIVSRLKKLPVKINSYPTEEPLKVCRFLNIFFKKNSFDVFHSHFGPKSGLFLSIACYNNIPVRIVHSHTTLTVSVSPKRRKQISTYLFIRPVLLHLIKRYANRYLACSEESAKWLFLPSIMKKKQYVIVPNGIVIEKFRCLHRKKHEPTQILTVGRFSPEKNPLFAVQVFYEYLKLDPTAQMTMIGNGPLNNVVRNSIERLNLSKHINLVPTTNEMPKYYQTADLFLFPSLYEGLGIALIEAQASGLKCLASEAVPQLAQCGLVEYKPLADGPEAWAEYMSQLLQNDSLNVDQEKLKYFDIKNTVRMIDEVYSL